MGYRSLDQTIPDAPIIVQCPGCVKLVVQISNQPVYIRFGQGVPSPVWGDAEPYQPVVGSLVRNFDAFQVWAYTPAAQLPGGSVQAYARLIPVP